FARLVYSANLPPVTEDATEAFFERWWALGFEHIFRGTERERPSDAIVAGMTTPSELSGVLNKALDFLPQVLKDGLTVTESMRQELLAFRRQSDPLSVWLMLRTVCDTADDNLAVACDLLIDAYNRDCEREGKPGMTSTSFGSAVRALRPGVERVQRTVSG